MRMNGFRGLFKVFIFVLFGSFMGLAVIGIPTVDVTAISVMLIFWLGLWLVYFVWKKVRPIQLKARIVKQSLYGQNCFAVEIDGVLLSELTWIPIIPETTAEIRDIIPCDEILMVRVNLYMNGTLLQVRKINCCLPPHVYKNISQ